MYYIFRIHFNLTDDMIYVYLLTGYSTFNCLVHLMYHDKPLYHFKNILSDRNKYFIYIVESIFSHQQDWNPLLDHNMQIQFFMSINFVDILFY